MKRITLFLLLTLALSSAFAQKQAPANQAGRQNLTPQERTERRAERMAAQMKLDESKAQWFKTLYAEYQAELRAVPRPERTKKRAAELSDEAAEAVLKTSLERQEQLVKLRADYYKKFKKQLTPQQMLCVFRQPQADGRNHRPAARKAKGKGKKAAAGCSHRHHGCCNS